MNKIQRMVVAALALLVLVLVILVGESALQTYSRWSGRPLGAPLPTSPYTPLGLPPTWTPEATRAVTTAGQKPHVTESAAPACGGPPVMTLLLIGSDTRGTGYTWGLSDVIRIARIDFTARRLTTLDFPRDLWVEIPEIADDLNGQDHEKLNQAYLYGNPGDGFGYWMDPSAGPGLLARTLDLNFGVKVDHYLAVNMQTFVRMVDAVDGVDVALPERVGGSKNPNLQAGLHHLDGTEALAVARNRAEGVFSRGENQNLVLCALQAKLTSPAVLPKIPELVRSFEGSVQTDLDPRTMAQLACLAGHVPAKNLAFYSFPEVLFSPDRVYDPVFEKSVFIWDVDTLVIRNYVAQFQVGGWPDYDGGGSSAQAAVVCK